ncbi:MAG: MFS transporter [Frankiales bacterium]|nr:MFS transporter [Frankiales bacterium]
MSTEAGASIGASRYRLDVAVVAMLQGLQFAFLVPSLALLLTTLYGASVAQVSLVLMVYNAACLVTVWAGSRLADRRGSYRTLVVLAGPLVVVLGLALGLAPSLGPALLALVLLGAPAAVGTPLAFGYAKRTGATQSQVVLTRAAFSFAWFLGPPVAALVISGPGPHALLLVVSAVGALTAVAGFGLRNLPAADAGHHAEGRAEPVGAPDGLLPADAPSAEEGVVRGASPDVDPAVEAGHPARSPRTLMVLLVVTFAALQAANIAGTSVMTLYVTETLHLPTVWGGAALGVAAALEVPALFALARLYRNPQDDLRLLAGATVIGVLYYLGAAAVASGPVLLALQVLNAAFYAVVAGVGLTLFQARIAGPSRASGMLTNSQRVGAIFAGSIIGLGSVGSWGLRAVWVGCAGVTLAALGLLLAARRADRRPSPP